ncbi:MAG: cupin domain-containing protein [Bryobacteraceae bacterium]|nr:cupin domain-containing protein [Bryobacteraceae bacterium]
MMPSRRDLALLLAAAQLPAQEKTLPSKFYAYEDLPVKANGENRSRAILDGKTHTGFRIEMHETELGAGLAPHAPHHHLHEELMIVREGTMEITITGKTQKLGRGSVAYVASNEEHGWRNIGTTRACYTVITLRG